MSYNLQLAVDILRLAEEIVGSTNSVRIDSGIYKHDIFFEGTEAEERTRHNRDIHTIRGTKNHPITLAQVTDAIAAMQDQFRTVSQDRSYFYEGLVFDERDNMYVINWGS